MYILQMTTKEQRCRKASQACDAVFYGFVSDAPRECKKLADTKSRDKIFKQPLCQLVEEVGEVLGAAYLETSDAEIKLQLLSALVMVFSGNEIQQFVPGITDYYITEAKKHAKMHGVGAKLPEAEIT